MRIAGEGADFCVTDDPHAMLRMLLLYRTPRFSEHVTRFIRDRPSEYRDIEPQLTSRRGHFESDVTAADDDQPFSSSQVVRIRSTSPIVRKKCTPPISTPGARTISLRGRLPVASSSAS